MPTFSMKMQKPMKPTLEIAEITDEAGMSNPIIGPASRRAGRAIRSTAVAPGW